MTEGNIPKRKDIIEGGLEFQKGKKNNAMGKNEGKM